MKKASATAVLESAATLAQPATKKILDSWLRKHPGFIVSDYNAGQMALLLKRKYGESYVYSEEDLDEVGQDLARMGILQIDADIEKQKQLSADEVYVHSQIALQAGRQAETEQEFDEEAASKMSNAELRRRSGVVFDPLGPQY